MLGFLGLSNDIIALILQYLCLDIDDLNKYILSRYFMDVIRKTGISYKNIKFEALSTQSKYLNHLNNLIHNYSHLRILELADFCPSGCNNILTNLKSVTKLTLEFSYDIAIECKEKLKKDDLNYLKILQNKLVKLRLLSVYSNNHSLSKKGVLLLSKMSSLEELELKNISLNFSFTNFTSVKKLILDNINISQPALESLCQLPNLEYLNIKCNNINIQDIANIKTLTTLMIISNITDDDLVILSRLTCLVDFIISSVNVTDAGIITIEKMTSLKSLDVVGCSLTKESRTLIQKIINRGCKICYRNSDVDEPVFRHRLSYVDEQINRYHRFNHNHRIISFFNIENSANYLLDFNSRMRIEEFVINTEKTEHPIKLHPCCANLQINKNLELLLKQKAKYYEKLTDSHLFGNNKQDKNNKNKNKNNKNNKQNKNYNKNNNIKEYQRLIKNVKIKKFN